MLLRPNFCSCSADSVVYSLRPVAGFSTREQAGANASAGTRMATGRRRVRYVIEDLDLFRTRDLDQRPVLRG